MRIKQLKIAGFRGFNAERTIQFDDRLTLIGAPNSHGKTSITEALEFLIYGETSKVAHAYSREEYKDSYRNRHFPSNQAAVVEATFHDVAGAEIVLRIELDPSGTVRRFVDRSPATEWPFSKDLTSAARPFVVQHALKDLLLATPSERFQGFARLLGLNDVEAVHQAIVNLCTKPEASIPDRAKKVLDDLLTLEGRMRSFTEFQAVAEDLKGNSGSLDQVYKKVSARAAKLIGKKVKPEDVLAEAIAARDKAAAKVYSGNVAIRATGPTEQSRLLTLRDKISSAVGVSFIEMYTRLAGRDATERLQKEANLLSIGLELLTDAPGTCPFCGQVLDEGIKNHVEERHDALKVRLGTGAGQVDSRGLLLRELLELQRLVTDHKQLLESGGADLVAATDAENQARVKGLFGKDNEASWEIVRSTSTAVAASHEILDQVEEEVRARINDCSTALRDKTEDVNQIENLGAGIQKYLKTANDYSEKLIEVTPSLIGPAHLLRQAIDAAAGTTELGLIIELLEKRTPIAKGLKIRSIIGGLKDLKRHVDQTVGEVMEAAFGADLTHSVMGWYGKIRTTADPDVHFSGFAMERTRTGDFKSRRVKVGAKSYGVELASAVSSLSESKLNALGLCMSIATAVRSPGPWSFLVLDDPIQSWDADHETRFIDVIRSLIEDENKQVILLSHRNDWVEQVSHGCRTLNGIRHCITGYNKEGPHLSLVDWASVDQRLREVVSILNNPKALPVQVQQAEAEIRLAVCQLVAEIAKTKLGRERSAHNINRDDARSILTSAGCPAALLDGVVATFDTTDDSHHAAKDYQPNVERIRKYHARITELRNWSRA